jgi:glycosyltransferase involved in cell wall biosynthesis
MDKISIIVPAYNEEEAIAQVIDGLKALGDGYEVIVVDDGSVDGTSKVLEGKGVRIIQHPYNKGYGAAIKTGVMAASCEVVFLMDADRQHRPADIPKLCGYLDNFDMVVGQRVRGSGVPLSRKWGRWALRRLANFLARREIPDLNSGFRAIKREVILRFMHILPDTFSFTTTLTLAVLKEGYNVKYIPIEARERLGRSSLNPLRDGYRTLLLIFSTIALFDPLRVFSPLAIVLFIPGFIYTLYQLIFFHNVPDSGVMFVISGILIFFFGILAEQVAYLRRQIK